MCLVFMVALSFWGVLYRGLFAIKFDKVTHNQNEYQTYDYYKIEISYKIFFKYFFIQTIFKNLAHQMKSYISAGSSSM